MFEKQRRNDEKFRQFSFGKFIKFWKTIFRIYKKHLKTLASQKILTDTRKKILSPYVYEKLIIWKYLL